MNRAWLDVYSLVPAFDFSAPIEPLSAGEHTRDMFLKINSAANPASFDAPNPCQKYSGKAPIVFCKPEGALHAWPTYATEGMFKLFNAL